MVKGNKGKDQGIKRRAKEKSLTGSIYAFTISQSPGKRDFETC